MEDLKANLLRIKELSKDVSLPSIAVKKHGRVKYTIDQGGCEGYGIYKEDGLSVQIVWILPNTFFPKHTHEKVEYLILLEGELANENGTLKEYNKGDVITIPPNTAHCVYTKKGCKLIAITPNIDEGYPDAR